MEFEENKKKKQKRARHWLYYYVDATGRKTSVGKSKNLGKKNSSQAEGQVK